MKNKNCVLGSLISLISIGFGLWLLLSKNISGTEFVALTLGFAIIGLIITFSSEVQEFSIAGNAVKLRELRSEAVKTLDELKQARTEIFRLLLTHSLEISGGFGSSLCKVDERVTKFSRLYNQIERFDCVKELHSDIDKVLNVLLICQYNELTLIHQLSKQVGVNFNELDSPQNLNIKLKDEMINQFTSRITPQPDFYDAKKIVLDGIEAYAKLYAIKVKLDKLEKEL